MSKIIRKTRSVCPVCLENLPARLVERENSELWIERTCDRHGTFSAPVWRGKLNFETWCSAAGPMDAGEGEHCPQNCGICAQHQIGTCCALLEVCSLCNLHCRFCFANGGEEQTQPDMDSLKAAVDDIVRQCGNPLLQLSGGEPSLRDDLPELIAYAKQAGCSYVQLNTNGIRLADDPEYAARLAESGLDIVFLQFDGTRDDIYTFLRGKPLLEKKLEAIRVCSNLRLGVTLVPTVVRGVNTDDLGNIVKLASELSPAVRGVHFQPVSFFGRFPQVPDAQQRYTLDELMADIGHQANIPLQSFMPSRCDHPLCGFHANFLIEPKGGLKPLSSFAHSSAKRGCETDNREYVARHWIRQPEESAPASAFTDEMDFDTFLYRLRHCSLTLSAMAFQDAMNLNIERLRSCSLHVYNKGKIMPFCANYLSPMEDLI